MLYGSNSPLSNIEISDYIRNKHYAKFSKGIDEIKKMDDFQKWNDGDFAVVYSKNIKSNGELSPIGHWTLLIKKNNDSWLYFDPENSELPSDIIKFLSGHNVTLYKNDIDIQNDESMQCGSFVLFVLDKYFSGLPFDKIINSFHDDTNFEKNNKILNDHF